MAAVSELRVQYAIGDALEQLRLLPDESVDSIVTDPPYGLSKEPDPVEVLTHWLAGDDYIHKGGGFMGKTWDSFVPGPSVWKECLRVLKPGGHLLCFAGTRTVDLMGISIRLGGFEIRDEISWLYGSGFPKSMDVSKAIDKAAGAERTEAIGTRGLNAWGANSNGGNAMKDDGGIRQDFEKVNTKFASATPEAQEWEGWGTALKPAHEPIIVARKPLSERTVAANVLTYGTGALNIDATRVSTTDKLGGGAEGETRPDQKGNEGWTRPWMEDPEAQAAHAATVRANVEKAEAQGRWPANLVLSHDEACVEMGTKRIKAIKGGNSTQINVGSGRYNWNVEGNPKATPDGVDPGYGDEDGMETIEAWECVPGCPVAALDEQSGPKMHGAGVARDGSEAVVAESYDASAYMLGQNRNMRRLGDAGGASRFFYNAKASKSERNAGLPDGTKNSHPTVKPVALMRWLVRMVTLPGGTVLDPYLGSGTTAVACVYEGFNFMGIEKEEEYIVDIAVHRVRYARAQVTQPAPVVVPVRQEVPKPASVSNPSPRKSPKIPQAEVKTVQCRDCGKDVETSIHWNGVVVCRECSRVKVEA